MTHSNEIHLGGHRYQNRQKKHLKHHCSSCNCSKKHHRTTIYNQINCNCGKIRDHCFHCHDHHDSHHASHCTSCTHHYHDRHDHHHKNHCSVVYDRFLCDHDFRIRLGGLQGGMNFRLRQLHGCFVKLNLEENKEVHGKISFVGSDYVEIKIRMSHNHSHGDVIKHHRGKDLHYRTSIISTDRIRSVTLDD